jgi:putative SOS response-associated peptidase YedK
MCYDVAYLTRKIEYYEKRFGASYGDVPFAPMYHSNGFDHMDIPVITNEDPGLIQLLSWGLIPAWVKDVDKAHSIRNATLNARDNTLFEKPSFKRAAALNRCLVLVDGFYDHHWEDNQSFPFLVKAKDGQAMALGGIWETWHHGDLTRHTVSIVTTDPNPRMAWLHNRPKASEGPRMPFVLREECYHDWLDTSLLPGEVLSLIQPYPQELLQDYPVDRLRGKSYPGNVPKIMEPHNYPQLNTRQGSLF